MKKAADTIFDCLEEKKMSQRQLAVCMGEDVRNLNQQLNRRNDMKVERFIDVLDYIGYRVEIVENDGIRKVSENYAKQIIENREPRGRFWFDGNKVFIGIDNTEGKVLVEEFASKEMCFDWFKIKNRGKK